MLRIPIMHDIENPPDDELDAPVTLFMWVRSMFLAVWQAYSVRNYYPLKM